MLSALTSTPSTDSLGQPRTFRLRPLHGTDRVDTQLGDGTVIVLPYETNLQWTHEVTKSARRRGQRIPGLLVDPRPEGLTGAPQEPVVLGA